MGQHKRLNDPNKRPNTHATTKPVNYLSFGRIPYKSTKLAHKIMGPWANNKQLGGK